MDQANSYNQRMQEEAAPRAQRVYEEHQAGKTFKAIAAEIGITPERARQLAERHRRQNGIKRGR